MPAKSLCRKKSVRRPNRCSRVRGCKIAKGTKRSFCRKKHNKSMKKSK